MERRTFLKQTGVAGIIFFRFPENVIAYADEHADFTLEESFRHPPSSVYPQTYWFWMNGNVTREGISLDLEAMKRAGVAGVFNFDVGTGIPKGPVQYLSEKWLELKKHAIREASRLGIAFTMHNCPGWSASGGPWITPELSMQQLTWSETFLSGDKQVSFSLPQPASRFNLYHDVAVIAFPSMEGEELMQTVKITDSKGEVIREGLTGNSDGGVIAEQAGTNLPAWLQFEFSEPYEARMISFFISMIPIEGQPSKPVDLGERTSVILESSNDGRQFNKVVSINTGLDTELLLGNKYITFDIPVTKAKYFRLTSPGTRRYRQVQFSGITRLKNWMEKTNLRGRNNTLVEEFSTIHNNNNQVVPRGSIVDVNAVLDLTQFTKNGLLNWDAPPGNWTVLRVGYTSMGTINRAAPDTGVGLECDKFNPEAISFHFNKMMEKILPVAKETKARLGLSIDSYEAGGQNWTAGFENNFFEKWKYSLIKYLPALAGGRILSSVNITERFLWDLRRLQADLIAENYYKRFTELCHQHNMTAYVEPYEMGPMEEMQIGSRGDVNLGEFWSGFPSITPIKPTSRRTTKLAASIAHINGKKLVGAEAFTAEPESARWQEYPFYLKAVGDKAFTMGVNLMIIHRFAHQPHPSALPGMSMGPWGIHFDRTNTWWNKGKEWLQYLGRCQYLLQQGSTVADLLYFSGDDANMYTKVEPEDLIPSPVKGFDYDLVNAEVMKNAKITDNKITLGNGKSYRVFVLQEYDAVSLIMMRKIHQLVKDGMIMIGAKPARSTGLSTYTKNDIEFKKITDELWGNEPFVDNSIGKGRVFSDGPLSSILLTALSIKPDFEYTSRSGNAPILYTHRRIAGGDLYFLSNQRRSNEEAVCSFRVNNKQPELWDATTGKIIKVGICDLIDGRVRFPIQFDPYGSVFVLFRAAPAANRILSVQRNGQTILSTEDFPSPPEIKENSVANSFTISFWAKPEINVLLNPNFVMGTISQPWTDYYAIRPAPGKKLFGEGHACIGITVGRNGVGVWEHEGEQPILVLPVQIAISGWSHISIVYQNNVPSVFVNGKWITDGKKSKYVVHAVIGSTLQEEGASYYNGDMTLPVIFPEAMKKENIEELSRTKVKISENPIAAEMTGSNKPALLIRKNGSYVIRNSEVATNPFLISKMHEGTTSSFSISNLPSPIELTGEWEVVFPPHSGAPSGMKLPQLISLHLHQENGVKYFSGTATYKKEFNLIKGSLIPGMRWFLDLGRVEVIASVKVNGKDFGNLWKRPYKIDVTEALREGINKLEVSVTNQWVNRLIGDEQLPDPDQFTPGAGSSGLESATRGSIERLPDWYMQGKPKPDNGRVTFTTWKHFTKDSPLIESGLIGPVILEPAMLRSL